MVDVISIHAELSADEIGKSELDERVMAVVREVPRHLFVPAPLAAGAYKEVPPPLIAQLKPGGRLVMSSGPAEDQRLSVIEKGADDGVKARAVMPVRFSELER